MNSKAVIGSLTTLFWSTIAIVIILLLFVFGSTIVKAFDNAAGNVRIYEPSEVGLEGGPSSGYFLEGEGYFQLTNFRFYLARGISSEEAILEVNKGVPNE